MDMIFSDVQASAESLFLSGNWTYLGMVVAALFVGVFSMRSIGQLLCSSVLAMIVLAVIWIGYNSYVGGTISDPATWQTQLQTGWANLGAFAGSTLVAHWLTFAISIGVLYLGKSLIFRG